MSRTNAKHTKLILALCLIAVTALLAACAGSSGAETKPATAETGEPVAAGPMSVTIVEPAEGAEVSAGTVKVAVETTGIKFAMPSNTLVDGEGHVHFTLDDRPFEMSIEKEIEFENVEPGPHTLKAELVQNDTQPFDPPVEQVIEFTAK